MSSTEQARMLLDKIQAISLKYSGLNEQNQHGFNVFSILREPHDEVGLHSAFLFSLLSPDGGHGQGKWFLDRFLEMAGLEAVQVRNVLVFREYKSDEGNIDIYVKAGDRAVIIENKIFAGDQENQLCRYAQIAIDEGFDFSWIDVIYLTLDGHEPGYGQKRESFENIEYLPSENETLPKLRYRETEKEIVLMSYTTHVINWLDECIARMATYPTTRETLILYQRLLKQLTGQSPKKEEIMEIANLIGSSGQNMCLGRKIVEAYRKAMATVQLKFWDDLHDVLNSKLEKLPYRILESHDPASQKYSLDQIERLYAGSRPRPWYGIKIKLGSLADRNIDLCFMIEVEHNIYYGFLAQKPGEKWESREKLYKSVGDLSDACKDMGYKTSVWWLGWKYPEIGTINFMNFDEQTDKMADKTHRSDYIERLSTEMLEAIQRFREEVEKKQITVQWGA